MAEELDAEVIESDIAISGDAFDIDLSVVTDDIAQLTSAIEDALEVRDSLDDGEDLSIMDAKVARKREQRLSKAIKEAESRRKKLKSDYSQPLQDAEERYRELMAPVVEMHAAHKERRTEAEAEARAAKKARLKTYYEELAPFIALPAEGAQKPLVPFERIFDERWLNKTFGMDEAEEAIDRRVQEIADMEDTLAGTELAYREEAMAAFWSELTIDAAVKRNMQLIGQVERARAMERERDERRRAQDAAQKQSSDVARMREAVSRAEPVETVRKYQITFEATPGQWERAKAALNAAGIHGKVRTLS